MIDAAHLAAVLHRARADRRSLDAGSVGTGLTLDEAYAVQDRLTALRSGSRIGWKLGYTSEVMRRQMGVDSPNFGPLLDDMVVAGVAAGFLHPRVEPEIGIVLGRELSGTDIGFDDVVAAIAEVRACLEVVDSIWADYRFTAAQNTADGSSAAGVVIGPVLDVDPARCDRIDVEFSEDDTPLATASSAAAGGHPLLGVAWLAAQLAARGQHLSAGELVITGGLTAATPLRPGRELAAQFGHETTVPVQRPDGEVDVRSAAPPRLTT